MKIKSIIIVFGAIALVGISCTSALFSSANGNEKKNELPIETAYINNEKCFAENLPYYEKNEDDVENTTFSISFPVKKEMNVRAVPLEKNE